MNSVTMSQCCGLYNKMRLGTQTGSDSRCSHPGGSDKVLCFLSCFAAGKAHSSMKSLVDGCIITSIGIVAMSRPQRAEVVGVPLGMSRSWRTALLDFMG